MRACGTLLRPTTKAQIEPKLEYYYKKYHGGLDGLDAIKQQAQASEFPAGEINIAPAKSPQEQIHDLIATTPDLTTLALADKETVLAMAPRKMLTSSGHFCKASRRLSRAS